MAISSRTPFWSLARICIGLTIGTLSIAPSRCEDLTLDLLSRMSLEELGELDFSSAGRRSQPWFETPAAGAVLRIEDLTLFGSDSIDEAVQMLPGIHVTTGRDTLSVVSVRGFNDIRSNKLLVQVDGRSIQSSANGSVLWADVLFPGEDLARIEVVRGPGASLWGANAINGIVAVTSKSARQTPGNLLSARLSSRDGARIYARHGGSLGDSTWYRISAEAQDSDFADNDESNTPEGSQSQEGLKLRVDHDSGQAARLTLLAEVARVRLSYPSPSGPTTDETTPTRFDMNLASVLGRLEHEHLLGGDLTVQLWASARDGNSREAVDLSGDADTRIFDVDLDITHHFRLAERHDVVWGMDSHFYRFTPGNANAAPGAAQPLQEASAGWFVQDEISLGDGTWRVTPGAKCEYHETVGWQLQPSLRLARSGSSRNTFWLAVSRATRSPSESERSNLVGIGPPPEDTTEAPPPTVDPQLAEEQVSAYEAGWRFRPTSTLTFDLAGYVNDYEGLATRGGGPPGPDTPPEDNIIRSNGTTVGYGFEASAVWHPNPNWEIVGALTLPRFHSADDSSLSINIDAEPRALWHLRSSVELPSDLNAGLALFSVKQGGAANADSYVRVDATLNWRPSPATTFTLGVQDATNAEARANAPVPGRSEAATTRDVFVRGTWRF